MIISCVVRQFGGLVVLSPCELDQDQSPKAYGEIPDFFHNVSMKIKRQY